MTESNVNTLIALADNHPGILTLIIICGTLLLIGIGFAVFFLGRYFINKYNKIKLPKGVEMSSEENKEIKSEVVVASVKEANKEAVDIKHDKQFIKALGLVIDASVQSGFNRSVKRQELFNRQLQFAHIRLDAIKSNIINEYIKETSSTSNLPIINVFLDYIFQECAYLKLESIFKADRLIEKSKETVIENNRLLIEGVADKMIHKAYELSQSKVSVDVAQLSVAYFDDTLIKLITSKTTEIKRAITDVIEKAYDIAVEEMDKMEELHSDLTQQINNILQSYLGNDSNLPGSWNDELPPNDIVGNYTLI